MWPEQLYLHSYSAARHPEPKPLGSLTRDPSVLSDETSLSNFLSNPFCLWARHSTASVIVDDIIAHEKSDQLCLRMLEFAGQTSYTADFKFLRKSHSRTS